VTSLLAAFAVPLEKQSVDFHHSVDALGIGRGAPDLFGLTAQQGMDPAIAVGGQIGD
jgi:hypothetical protein